MISEEGYVLIHGVTLEVKTCVIFLISRMQSISSFLGQAIVLLREENYTCLDGLPFVC